MNSRGDTVIPRSEAHHYKSCNTVTNQTGTNHQQFPSETLPLIDVYKDGLWIAAVTKNAGLSEVFEGPGLLFQPHTPLGTNIK